MTDADLDAVAARQLELLLAPPTDEDAASYYDSLLLPNNPGHGDVTVARSDTYRGRGLFAARDFTEGERVLREPPRVGIQQEHNRCDALVCAECFRYVGSIERQIATRLLHDSHSDACEGVVDRRVLEELQSGVKSLPDSRDFPMPECFECHGGCDRNVYCSDACTSNAWSRHERHLCVGPVGGERGLAATAFVNHAKETNDIFPLAARVLLETAHRAELNRFAAVAKAKASNLGNRAGNRRGPMPERRVAPLRRSAQRYLVGGGVTARGRRGGRRRGRVSKFDEGDRGGIPRLVTQSLGALRPGDA